MNIKLESIYNQIPKSTCPEGCGKCCGSVFPSMAEIRNIKDWCSERNIEYKNYKIGYGDCPYLLGDKTCEIYPVRPFLCRVLGTSVELPCPLGLNNPVRILNSRQTDILYRYIYLNGKEKPRTEKHRIIIRKILTGG